MEATATSTSISRLMDKEDMEYYAAIKKNKILPFAQHGWTWRVLCLEK